jgi:Fe2+ or Zn2+ uptake regulation protein
MNFLDARRRLIRYSINPSAQRTAIMEYLLNNRIHPTVDEIYSSLLPSMPTLSKTTVYNTLNLFVESGVLRVLFLDGKNARYDIGLEEHAHFICKKCGGVHDIFGLQPVVFDFPKHKDFEIESGEIFYTGLCNKCNTKRN